MKKLYGLIILIFSSIIIVNAQGDDDGYYIAEDFIEDENFIQAIDVYKKLLYQAPNNSDLNFKIGFCYLNTPFEKHKAIPHLRRASSNYSRRRRARNQPPIETFYYLGRAYQITYKFEAAIQTYNYLKNRVRGVDVRFNKLIDREIERSSNALGFYLNPVDIKILDTLPRVNMDYYDYSPVLPADESIMFFTSRRESNMVNPDNPDNVSEDIYYTIPYENTWDSAKSMGKLFNTIGHDAVLSISTAGDQVFIYRDYNEGTLLESHKEGNTWTKPTELNENINTPGRETHACLSPDGNSLYFTSERKKGYGGLDIYISHKMPNGDWGVAENLGPEINSDYDEEAPFVYADGRTLFFSSKGHHNMGGYDIFSISLDKSGKWLPAENLGYPINTPENDMFINVLPDGKTAYIVSRQIDGKQHYPNIFKVEIPNLDVAPVSTISGTISICNQNLPPVLIKVFNSETSEEISSVSPNKASGKYLVSSPSDIPIRVDVVVDGAVVWSQNFASSQKNRNLVKNIRLRSEIPCDSTATSAEYDQSTGILHNGVLYDEKIEVDPYIFGFGKVQPEKGKGIDKLIAYLLRNPDSLLEIGAYADSRGPENYNLRLTEMRANMVLKYFRDKGVPVQQLVARGYGENQPVVSEYDARGNYIAEAGDYNRRVEFKLLKQGKSRLYIKHLFNIPEELQI